MFQLTSDEFANLKSQIVTSSWGGTRKLPLAFTEQGIGMLSGLLNSDVAIDVSIKIMRAFVAMRQFIIENASKFKEIEDLRNRVKLLEEYNEDILKVVNDLSEDTQNSFDDIYIALSEMASKQKKIDKPRNPIGFKKGNSGNRKFLKICRKYIKIYPKMF